MSRRILLIIGSALPDSVAHSAAAIYAQAAQNAGAEVRHRDLADSATPALLLGGSDARHEAEHIFDEISWADHLLLVRPHWWGQTPSVLTSFLDRVLIEAGSTRGDDCPALLRGRSARIVVAGGERLFRDHAALRDDTALTRAILRYRGIATDGFTHLTTAASSDLDARLRWTKRVQAIGRIDAAGGVAVPTPALARRVVSAA